MTTVNTLSYTLVDINTDCGVTWSSTLNSSTVYYPAVICVKTVEQINEEFANGTLNSSTVYDPVPYIYEEKYANSRDSTPSPGKLYIDESEDSVETVEQINEEYANGTLDSSTVFDPVPYIYEEEYANSRDFTPSPGKLYIDESEDSVETVEQIKGEFANSILNSSTVYNYVKYIYQEEYADSRDSTPSPGPQYFDESEDSEKSVEQINGEFANGTLKSSSASSAYDPVPHRYEEYAHSRDSTPSPGKQYIDESEDSENFLKNSANVDDCSMWSTPMRMSTTAPLSPINGPTSPVAVKYIKKVYEKNFPRHCKAKLLRQRVMAYCVPKKIDFDQPEDSE